MRKSIFSFVFILFTLPVFSQHVNGVIISDSANLTVVKVWGTHYERGFAYGYLCGDKILDMYHNYYLPNFGTFMSLAYNVVSSGAVFKIDSVFFEEAIGLHAGMDSAGFDTQGIDHINLLVGNCLLELLNLTKNKEKAGMGCSSLMSWGQATVGTDLNGRSVITRHLDWSNDAALVKNQVMVIHLPSEADEQPWISIGFAGQISALSGVNAHFGTFQHMMSDFSGSAVIGTLYEPVWFCLRRALEKKDLNGDGLHDARDVRDALLQSSGGLADGYIISTLARATADSCHLIAEVAEVAPAAPFHVFRSNDFPDSIPSDNLYAANYEIKRNHHYHFCTRYNNVLAALGNGTGIGSQENWNIMRDTSGPLQGMANIQMMQFIPEDGVLKLSVQKHGKPAYMNPPDTWLLSELFTNPALISVQAVAVTMNVFPNPAKKSIRAHIYNQKPGEWAIRIFDLTGRQAQAGEVRHLEQGHQDVPVDICSLKPGVYLIQLSGHEHSYTKKFIVME